VVHIFEEKFGYSNIGYYAVLGEPLSSKEGSS